MTESLEFGEKKKRVIAAEHKATRALTGRNSDRKTKGEWDASVRWWTGENSVWLMTTKLESSTFLTYR